MLMSQHRRVCLVSARRWKSPSSARSRPHSILAKKIMMTREQSATRSVAATSSPNVDLQEVARLKSEFAANISHELRTPLNAIIGFTHLAIAAKETAKQQRYLENVHRSAQGLLGMINNILEMSATDLQHAPHDIIHFDFDTWLTNALLPVSEAARARELKFSSSVCSDVPFRLIGNAGRLMRVLQLFCDNAVKFTPSGSVSVHVDVQQLSGDVVTLRFRIKDTGVGIAADKLALLFTPFQQVDGSLSRRHGGMGLGLALAKKLVNTLGGEVGAESRPQDGSLFWFTARLGLQSPAMTDMQQGR